MSAQTGDGGDSPRVEELYGQAKTAQSQGDIATAIARYEEILRIAPRLGPAYNNLGALYFRQREYRKAAGVLEAGLKVSPAMPSASALLGISLFEMGEYGKARPRLESALRANAADSNAEMYLVRDLTKLGDYEAAETHLRQLAGREPKNQEVWYLLAKIHMKLSEQDLARMNAIDPNSVLSYELSAETMEAMKNYDGAVVQLKKAVEMAPRRPGTHYKLGDAYYSLSQWDSATEQFQAELSVDPANCTARWKIGAIVLERNGSPDEALADVDRALAMCPSLTDARVDRARALIRLNRNAEAVTDLEAAAKADPAEPSTHFLLAKVYRAVGRTQDAQAEMQTFSKLEESARAATAERAQEVIKNKETAH
ncbi:MAG: tetratricopeptide repeat protein [Bryobacteraceae bacterium]